MAAADPLHTETGGRDATTGVIPGRFALSVGMPPKQGPKGWNWTPLSKVARLESGHTPSRKVPEYWGGDVPWIGIRDATANHGRTIFETQQYTNNLGIENSSARILPANTVCLSRTASVGYVVVMGRPMATSQDFVNWVCSDELDYRFLKYVLLAEGDAVLQFASGTTHQTIYYPEAKAFHVCMPAPTEQSRIADVLQALDDKIELNRRMNETLEAMARAIYANAVRDWPLTTVSALADIFDGPHATPPKTKVGPIFLGISNLASGQLDLSATEHVDEEYFLRWTRRVTPEVGDVVFSYETRLGQCARIPRGMRCCLGRRMGLLRPKPDRVYSALLLESYLAPDFQDTLRRRTIHGSTVDRIPLIEMGAFPVRMASIDDQTPISEIVTPLRDRMDANAAENETLSALRDLLLPKLMSGEIRVKDAEKLVGEAT